MIEIYLILKIFYNFINLNNFIYLFIKKKNINKTRLMGFNNNNKFINNI